jgi:hypothetical protein
VAPTGECPLAYVSRKGSSPSILRDGDRGGHGFCC